MTRRDAVKVLIAGPLLAPALLSAGRPESDEEQLCQGNVCFPRSVDLNGASLPIRGTAKLTWWGFSVYTAALYVGQEADTMDKVLGNSLRRLVLHYHRSIKATDIQKASEYWIGRNSRNDPDALRERLDWLFARLKSVKEGDQYHITHIPGTGTVVQLNSDTPLEPIAGEDFARAFFGIWLSEEPLRKDLRDRLLYGTVGS